MLTFRNGVDPHKNISRVFYGSTSFLFQLETEVWEIIYGVIKTMNFLVGGSIRNIGNTLPHRNLPE